jgi:hypothetical protein
MACFSQYRQSLGDFKVAAMDIPTRRVKSSRHIEDNFNELYGSCFSEPLPLADPVADRFCLVKISQRPRVERL